MPRKSEVQNWNEFSNWSDDLTARLQTWTEQKRALDGEYKALVYGFWRFRTSNGTKPQTVQDTAFALLGHDRYQPTQTFIARTHHLEKMDGRLTAVSKVEHIDPKTSRHSWRTLYVPTEDTALPSIRKPTRAELEEKILMLEKRLDQMARFNLEWQGYAKSLEEELRKMKAYYE